MPKGIRARQGLQSTIPPQGPQPSHTYRVHHFLRSLQATDKGVGILYVTRRRWRCVAADRHNGAQDLKSIGHICN